MKKVLSILLCLCMLLSMVSILSSCSLFEKSNEPKVSKKTVKVDLTDYQVVFASDLTANVKTHASTLSKALTELTETPVREKGDGESVAVETADLEILVGNTMRTETVKAMKGLGDFGWTIRVFENKICIVGTTPFLTMVALNYFTQNYVNDECIEDTTITLNKTVSQKKLDTVALVEEVEDPSGNYLSGLFQIVYDDVVDDEAQTTSYATDPNPTQGGNKSERSSGVDYRYDFCLDLSKSLSRGTTAGPNTFIKKDDVAEESEFEILLGNMDRDIVKEELNKIEANQYGLKIRDGKIFVLGWNDVAIAATKTLFDEMVNSCAFEDKKGNVSYVVPENISVLYTLENNWDVSFPKPEGNDLYLHGTQDVGNDSVEFVYTGKGANEAAYLEYCTKLEEAGYSIHGYETKGYNNTFRYYVHKGTGSALYVYYSPYSFAAEQQVRNDYVPGIRIIASNTESVTLPDVDILDANMSYTKVCESTITSLKFDYDVGSWGLSYVLRLEDGSFVIFDGGAGHGWDDYKYLRETVMNLYHEVFDGDPTTGEPTAAEPLHVRAWMITHEHQDHFNVFTQFMEGFGPQNWFRFDFLLFNATSKAECYNCDNPEYKVRDTIEQMQEKVQNGFDYIKVHTGQTFYFANLKIEILYTHEDTYPLGLEYFNNSSTVFKTTFMNNGVDADSGIWLGDLERIGSRRLRAMWGSEGLKADMVQVAHHGYNGVEAELYDQISPTIVWFPSSTSRYTNESKAGYSFDSAQWMRAVNHHLCWEIPTVKLIIMADTWDTTMDFVKGKAQMDSLRDINHPEKEVKHDDRAVIYTAQRT